MAPEDQSIRSQVGQYLEIAWRRKYCALPLPFLAAIAIYYALSLPPLYQSMGVIMVENQTIPQDLVRTTVTTYAAQQIEVIRQQIESTGNVMQLVEKHNLYNLTEDFDPSVVAQRFRNNMWVETVNADIMDPGSGRQRTVSIAFRVGFLDQDPYMAQQIATDLSQLFLETNTQRRTREAVETSTFLRNEADTLQARVIALEDKMADFRNRNANSLPELLQYNLSVITSAEEGLRQNQVAIDNLTEQEQLLSIELRSMDPYTGGQLGAPTPEAGLGPITPSALLAQRKTELSQMLRRYSESHPNVQALRSEVQMLEREVKATSQFSDGVYVEDLDSQYSPVYLQLRYRIGSIERDVDALVAENTQLKDQIDAYNERVSKTYLVQREYDELQRDYQATFNQYEELRRAQYEAEVAQTLEEESQSESLSLIESPKLPRFPVGPDRPKIMVLGIGFAAAVCVGLAVLLEALDGSVYGRRGFRHLVGDSPLVSIPTIRNKEDELSRSRTRKKILLGSLLGLVLMVLVVILVIHFFVVDLRTIDIANMLGATS